MKYLISIIILSLSINCCSSNDPESQESTFKLSDTLSIDYRETLFNEEENITIKFDSLISDGRCPVDMMCVWEGDAVLRFVFSKGNHKAPFKLHTAKNYFTSDTLLLGYHIELINVFPYPHSEIKIEPKNYFAKLIIE